MATIVKLKTPTTPAPKPQTRAALRAMRRQRIAAALVGTATIGLIGLSLHDLACGMSIATGMSMVKSGAMAFGIDFGYVSAETAKMFARGDAFRKIRHWANGAIVGTMAWSAILNAAAWSSDAVGWWHYGSMALGASIPALIFTLSHIATTLWMDTDR